MNKTVYYVSVNGLSGMLDVFGWLLAAVLVLATIGIHYEIMRIVSDVVMPWSLKRFHDRRVIMLMIVVLMLGHIIEIWMFALTMLGMTLSTDVVYLSGDFDKSLSAFLYFSAVNYTSTGYGDISPHGIMRSISVSEALVGLMMIAWSASFTYLKMEQIWQLRRRVKGTKKSIK